MTALDTVVETTRTGQIRLTVPEVPRQPHPTGQQEPCSACAVAGVDRQGVSRDGPGSSPLCMSCWRGRRQRRARHERQELAAGLWEGLGEAEAAAACQACGSAEPVPDCWLCAWSWLAAAGAELEYELAAEAAEAVEFERIAARSEAEDRVEAVEAWIERLRAVLTGYAAGGRWGRWGRAVELLAELAARDAAARTTARGRPSWLLHVGGVLAVDSNYRSGRGGMPGRARTAELVGCSEGAVTAAWRRSVRVLGWAERVKIGGRLPLAERMAKHRWNDRAEFDIVPAHLGDPAVRAPYVPVALGVLGELLEHALAVLADAQETLDELRARTGRWTDWPERVRRTRLRQAVTRVRDKITAPLAALALTANICAPHTVSKGEYFSSCSWWGLQYTPPIMIHSDVCRGRPTSGRDQSGASRSSTESRSGDLESWGSRRGRWDTAPCLERPRTLEGSCDKPRRRGVRRPEWAEWAEPMARDLRKLWPWLAADRPARVAAVLGAALGPHWTAAALVRHATRCGWMVPDQPDRPLGYLKTLLTGVLTCEVEPPYPARRTIEARRDAVAADAQTRQADRASWCGRCDRHRRVEVDDHDRTVPCPRCSPAATARLAEPAGDDWPEVTQPGAGLPPTPAGAPGRWIRKAARMRASR